MLQADQQPQDMPEDLTLLAALKADMEAFRGLLHSKVLSAEQLLVPAAHRIWSFLRSAH